MEEIDRGPRLNRPGDQLKVERERLGMVLEQVSASTKIRKDYLQAIERHDWDALPGNVFTQGYLRSYAQCLGLDPKHLLMAYARERRILGVEISSVAGAQGRDATKVLFERLAKTHGIEPGSVLPKAKWIALSLVVVVAIAGWTVLHFLHAGGDRTPVASVTPVKVESPSPSDTGPQESAATGHPVAPGSRATTSRGRGPSAAQSPLIEPATPAGARTLAAPPPPEGAKTLAAPPPPAGRALAGSEPGDGASAKTSALASVTGANASPIAVAEFGVGTKVVGHRLVGQSDRFEEGTVAWFWTRLIGARAGETIQHVWLHEGRQIAVVKLRVGGRNWRTHSRNPLIKRPLGAWTVEARGSDGRVLASARFTCLPKS